MPGSVATTRVPAAAVRSSRSVTGLRELRIGDCGLRIGGTLGRIRNPQSAIFRCRISPVGTYVPPMPLRLAEHPAHDRPRERLWSVGPAAPTGQELLAILLGTGSSGRDALAVAGDVLARVDGSLRRLAGRPSAELAKVTGVGRTKAARVRAALELGRRVGTETEPPPERVRGPADVQRFYGTRLRDLAVGGFHVLALGTHGQVLGDLFITRGLFNSSLLHPREAVLGPIAHAAVA